MCWKEPGIIQPHSLSHTDGPEQVPDPEGCWRQNQDSDALLVFLMTVSTTDLLCVSQCQERMHNVTV